MVAEYLKLTEVARRLDVSEKTARRYVRSGTLPSVFIGGAYRVSETDLEAFLENAKVQPGKAQAPSSQRSLFNNGLEEERRSPLSPWAEYARRMAARIRDHTEDPNSLAFRDTWAALFFVEEKNREAADLYSLLFEEEMGQDPYGDEPLAALKPALAAFEELAESLAEAQRRAEQMAEEVEDSEIGQARRSAAASVAQRKQAAAQFNAGRERRGA